MATDYDDVARLSKPTMMPDATYGIGLYAGLDYQRQQAQHQGDLQNARNLAGLGAEMDAQKHQEYMRGAPTREAQSQVDLAKAKFNLESLPEILKSEAADRELKITKADSAKRKEVDEVMDTYLAEWMEATTPEMKQEVIASMKKKGLTHIGSRSLDDIDMEALDRAFQIKAKGRTNSIEQRQKMQVEGAKTERTRITAEAGVERAEIQAKAKGISDQIRLEMKKVPATTKSQWEASMWEKMTKGTMSELEKAVFTKYQQDELAEARAKAGNQPPQVDPAMFPPGVMQQPKIPGVAPIPEPAPTGKDGKQYEVKQISEDGKWWKLSNGDTVKAQ
jgi:multidrug efflux pump subunit AcrA (membrane-fusion protein)